ncbi:helix-turn-helix domain-containing protein [Myxococcaceae bacterium GXIMD 01537]
MARLMLAAEQAAEQEEKFRTTDDWRLRERCQAVLMASRGRMDVEIARDLAAGARTVASWLSLYRERGLEGLVIRWPPGRKRLIPEELASRILEWVRKGPAACGVERAGWTHEALAEHLFKETGVRVKETAMGDFCRRHGVRLYRPSYRFLRGDEEKQAQALAALREKKWPQPGAGPSF